MRANAGVYIKTTREEWLTILRQTSRIPEQALQTLQFGYWSPVVQSTGPDFLDISYSKSVGQNDLFD